MPIECRSLPDRISFFSKLPCQELWADCVPIPYLDRNQNFKIYAVILSQIVLILKKKNRKKQARYGSLDNIFWKILGRPGKIRTNQWGRCPDKRCLFRIRPPLLLPGSCRQESTHTLRHNLSVSLMAHQITSWGRNFDTPTYLPVRCHCMRLGVWVSVRCQG